MKYSRAALVTSLRCVRRSPPRAASREVRWSRSTSSPASRRALIRRGARRELRIRNIEVRVVTDPNAQESAMDGHYCAPAVCIVEIRSTDDVASSDVKGVVVHRKERNDAGRGHVLPIGQQGNGYVAGRKVVQEAVCPHAGSRLDGEIGRDDFSTPGRRTISHDRCLRVTGLLAFDQRNRGVIALSPLGSILSLKCPH